MYITARLLEDVAHVFVENSPGNKHDNESIWDLLNEDNKDYYRWTSRILLLYFTPYYYDNNGDLVEFYLEEDARVNMSIYKKNNNFEYSYCNILDLEEFIVDYMGFVNLNYPKTESLMIALEEYGI